MDVPQQPVYAMLRGSEQVIRVNIVQYVWSQTLGYLLHPTIPRDIGAVADVATASGLWLCELDAERKRLQQAEPSMNLQDYQVLDGFDISAKSFLPEGQKLSKVTLRAQDAREEVPTDLKGKYDVVHVRLIQPGIYDGDPSSVIKHCQELLRPGGYLQWEEFDVLAYDVVNNDKVQPGASHLQQVVDKFKDGNPKEWVSQLPTTLEKHGFSVKVADRMRESVWHRSTTTQLVCGVIDEISRARVDKIGPPGAGDKLRAVVREAIQENLNGSYASSLFQVVVAQKAV